MKKILILLALLTGSFNSLCAQQRTSAEAKQIASEFLNQRPTSRPSRLNVLSPASVREAVALRRSRTSQPAGSPQPAAGYYIVNDEANQRFVVVSADKRMYQILGYSDSGTFAAGEAPVQLFDILAWYDAQRAAIPESTARGQAPRRERVKAIAPLIQTKWGQESPYNNDCPTNSWGIRLATGCVATAMAQVMNYHQYPAQGQGGTVDYTTETLGIRQTMDFDALSLDWSKMSDTYSYTSPQASKQEVAKLMHACGVSVLMDYNTESGSTPNQIPYAVINHFGYNPNTQHLLKNYYDSDEWNSIIRSELAAGRPLLYGGIGPAKTTILGDTQEMQGGHRFILDGMDENGLYHFNFGWTGDCDGYFAIDAVNPTKTSRVLGVPTSTVYDFNQDQGMVVGMSPHAVGKEEDIFYTIGLELETSVAVDAATSLTYRPYCCANKASKQVAFRGKFGLGVFSRDWQLVETLFSDDELVSMLHAGGFTNRSVTRTFSYNAQTFQNGRQYYIALYAQHDDSPQPTLVRTPNGEKDWFRATVTGGTVTLESKQQITDGTSGHEKGDVNGDGRVNRADIDSIISVMAALEGGAADSKPSAETIKSADVNGDGRVDVADIVYLSGLLPSADS